MTGIAALLRATTLKEVGVEPLAKFVERHVFGETAHAEAGVVDEHVQCGCGL
jgi:hypothetical protein